MSLVIGIFVERSILIWKESQIRSQPGAFHQRRQLTQLGQMFVNNPTVITCRRQIIGIETVCNLPVVVNDDNVFNSLGSGFVKKSLVVAVDQILHILFRGYSV